MLSVAVKRAERSHCGVEASLPSRRLHPRIPLRRQIDPLRIAAFEQRDFLGTRPTFQLLLPSQSLVHIVVRFPIQQANHLVPCSESLVVMKLVLEHALVRLPLMPVYRVPVRLPMM